MKKLVPCALLFSLALGIACTPASQPSDERLEEIPYLSTETNANKNFYLYVPKEYDSNKEKNWPVLLFLHGNGERGDGLEDLPFSLAHGPLYEAWVQKRDLPFLIIAPQLPLYGFDTLGISYLTNRKLEDFPRRLQEGVPARGAKFGSNEIMTGKPSLEDTSMALTGPPMGWNTVEDDLLSILDMVKRDFRVDESRIYISGLSYGGFGTWYMASAYPDLFAAANPIVGWGDPDLMAPIAQSQIPIWCFAGGRDPVIHVENFYPGINKLEELGHKNIRFTVEEDMSHDVWTRVYAGDDIYKWLLSHKKEK